MKTYLRLSLLAVIVLVGACASSPPPQPRMVVLMSGNKSVRGDIKDAVAGRYQLVSSKRYSKTARKLDVEPDDSKGLKKVAKKLDLEAVVEGDLVKKGRRRYELRLTLRAGYDGREFDMVKIKLKSKKLKKKDRKKLKKRLGAALADLQRATIKNRKKKARKKRKKSKRLAREKKRRNDDNDDDDYDDDYDDERAERKRKKKKKKKDESYEVVTTRDTEGQAIDDESPF